MLTGIARLEGLVADGEVRELFGRFCRQVPNFCGELTVETTRFEIRYTGEGGFSMTVTPYRDLFVVALGNTPSIQLRVFSRDGFIRALDLALSHFLENRSSGSFRSG